MKPRVKKIEEKTQRHLHVVHKEKEKATQLNEMTKQTKFYQNHTE